MKILMLFPNYPPNYTPDGVGDYTRIIVSKLRGLGLDVWVIASTGYKGSDNRVFKLSRRKNWGIKELIKVVKVVNKNKFNLVHLQYTPESYGFGISFKFLPLVLRVANPRLQFITTFHTLVGGRWISKINAVLLSIFSQKLISTNEELTFLFTKWLWFLRYKLHEIPIGSNIIPTKINKKDAKSNICKRFGLKESATLLSNFGFSYPGKGLEPLFNAIKMLNQSGRQEYYLFLVGALREEDREYRKNLCQLITQLNLDDSIFWINGASEKEISELLIGSDIYVVPYDGGISTRRGSLIAGIIHHLPIVSTYPKIPTPIFKDSDNVLLVEPANPVEIARAIQKLSEDEGLRNRLVQNIAETAKKFDWTDIACRTARVYQETSWKIRERIRYILRIARESIVYSFEYILRKREIPMTIRLNELNPARRILVIQRDSIGDVLMTTPVFRALREKFSDARIDVLVLPDARGVLKNNPRVDNVYFWHNTLSGFIKNLKMLRTIRNNNYELCIDYSWSCNSTILRLNIPLSIAPYGKLKRGIFWLDTSKLYSRTISTSQKKHIVLKNLELIKSLRCSSGEVDEEFFIGLEDKKLGDNFLQVHKLIEKTYAVIHPGAKWPLKRWAWRNFSELISLLKKKGIKTVLIGSSRDRMLLEDIKEVSGAGPVVTSGNLDFGSLAYIMQNSLLFVGNDSGPAHIAAAVGVPSIVLFGPTEPESCSPMGKKVIPVRIPMPCSPCILYYRKDRCEIGSNICMQKISPAQVMKVIEKLIC